MTIRGTCHDTGGSGCTGDTIEQTKRGTRNDRYSPGNACDNAGNCVSCPKTKVMIDQTPPSVIKASSAKCGKCSASEAKHTWYIQFHLTDNESGLDYRKIKYNGIGPQRDSFNGVSLAPDCVAHNGASSSYTITELCDKVGNCVSSGSGFRGTYNKPSGC